MIGWMQNNNKYLVVTMWIAAIAFIGAGAVGWGGASFGSQANSVAKVGDIEISRVKYGFNYNNLFQEKANEFKGNFDKKRAEELGLDKAVLNNLINEAVLLNFAKDNGIIATEKEVGLEIASIDSFKDKTGMFNDSIYKSFLKSRGLKAKDFDSIVRDGIVIRKTLNLLNIKPLELEKEAMSSTFKIADKIKYRIINKKDIDVAINEAELKKYWEKNKINYMSKPKYELDVLYTGAKDVNISNADIEKYYNENNINYSDASGKIRELSEVKSLVINDLKLKLIKKEAARDRSKFKKGKIKASESIVIEDGDGRLNSEIWKSIKDAKEGDFLKPKALKDRYITINLKKRVEPKIMSFEEAKPLVKKEFINKLKEEKLAKLVKQSLESKEGFDIEPKNYITLSKVEVLPKLTPQDSMLLTREVFSSNKKRGSTKIANGVVVFEIVDQKLLDNNNSNQLLDNEIEVLKSSELSSNLISDLSKKYNKEIYIKGVK